MALMDPVPESLYSAPFFQYTGTTKMLLSVGFIMPVTYTSVVMSARFFEANPPGMFSALSGAGEVFFWQEANKTDAMIANRVKLFMWGKNK